MHWQVWWIQNTKQSIDQGWPLCGILEGGQNVWTRSLQVMPSFIKIICAPCKSVVQEGTITIWTSANIFSAAFSSSLFPFGWCSRSRFSFQWGGLMFKVSTLAFLLLFSYSQTPGCSYYGLISRFLGSFLTVHVHTHTHSLDSCYTVSVLMLLPPFNLQVFSWNALWQMTHGISCLT